ncbi:PREDICTED: uncharacterized protein LOC104720328 [Camelina sativa]|uniref:ATP-dependent DNA helicase n=1 Tax=Camelina sativa TaxID=90675 RepID=A0ABM0U6B6_CAMSA|nr:PREDICTED: uncharacterized protein LOC104720328 [Camelina sativa]
MEDSSEGLRLMVPSERTTDARTHNLPTSKEVAALIPGDFTAGVNKRDIVIESCSGNLQRISELYPAYLSLQYPVLFPYGEDGYRLGIDIGFVDTRGRKRKMVTMREFYAYRVFERYEESSIVVMAGKLFQQFLVDAFTIIESNRLNYIWINQSNLRTERVDKITEAAEKGHGDLAQHGKRIFIPSSFTGGKRYMMQHYLDAMATCKYYGFPDLFITFTCNPRWHEIDRYLQRHRLSKKDRPDICSRVFKMKLDRLLDQVTKKKTFGIVNSAMYTIEFQKRGLPHAHMILFLHRDNKIRTTDDIDKFISAEIPDKEVDKYLYEVVSDVMIHGPCGPMNRDSVCMNNGKCTKFFPKPYMDNTIVDDAGYPLYRRRNDGRVVEKGAFNTIIVMLFPIITRSVKYLFKYTTKGPDYVRANVGGEDQENEIKKYFNCRYVSACEASWRIFAFPICYRTTPVEKLPFHLPGQELDIYNQDDPIEDVLHRTMNITSKFLGWMECNKIYPQARELTYAEFPSKFVWNKKEKLWKPRSEKRKSFAIGRITYVPPSVGQAYYLRVLLNKIPGPTSFDYLKTVNSVLYKDFQEACYALGLLDDDKEYIAAINEAGLMLRSNGTSLTAFEKMPKPDDSIMKTGELYDKLLPMLTDEQRRVYEEIIHSVNHDKGGMFFVCGFGDTGKTFMWTILGADKS